MRYILPAVLALGLSCLDDPVELGDHDDFEAQLELVWQQYDELFPGFIYLDSVDWDEVYDEYSAAVDTVTCQASFMNLMGEMLSVLEDCSVYLSFGGSLLFPFVQEVEPNYDWDVLWSNYLEPAGFEWLQEDWWGCCVIDSIPYILITEWTELLYGGYLDDVIQANPNAPAMIIDVRLSSGGSADRIGQVAMRFNDVVRVGYFTVERDGPAHADLADPVPRFIYVLQDGFDGPVAVLCGENCGGAAELFVCMASELPHSTLMGDTTMGQSTSSLFYPLPGGHGYSVPVETALRADTVTWVQGAGVAPDAFVEATSEDFAAGVDPVFEYALDWARSR